MGTPHHSKRTSTNSHAVHHTHLVHRRIKDIGGYRQIAQSETHRPAIDPPRGVISRRNQRIINAGAFTLPEAKYSKFLKSRGPKKPITIAGINQYRKRMREAMAFMTPKGAKPTPVVKRRKR